MRRSDYSLREQLYGSDQKHALDGIMPYGA